MTVIEGSNGNDLFGAYIEGQWEGGGKSYLNVPQLLILLNVLTSEYR